MRNIQELENAVLSLPENDYKKFRRWFFDQDWEKWDRQIAEDAETGKLDFLLAEAGRAKEKNRLRDL